MSGLKIAASYSLRPHQLGLCGPRDDQSEVLKKIIQGKTSSREVKKVLRKFQAAYPYYRLIAKCNNKNPFDSEVVKAYWIGNHLLDNVSLRALRRMIIEDFCGEKLLTKKVALKKAKSIPVDSKPHHSFHVLVIGSVTGSVDLNDIKLVDACRISWGKVQKYQPSTEQNQKITVLRQPLVIKNGKTTLSDAVETSAVWNKDLLIQFNIGDWVSIHWGQIVQVLNSVEVANLEKYTNLTLKSLRSPKK